MIVCKSEKELANATNASDAAGAVAVKEYVAEHAGADLTPSTTVTVSGAETTLESYIEDVTDEALAAVDISSSITLTNTRNDISITYAYKVGKLLFIKFRAFADSDYSVSGGEVWAKATITGLSLKTDNVTVMADYSENDLASNATLASNEISFYALPFNVGDDGASANAAFVVLLN